MSRRRFLRDSALSAASFAAPWAFGGRESECVAAAATDTVWELSLKNGRAENCHLSFAQVVAVGDGANGVECDSRRDRTAWHSCIVVPSGLIKAGQSVVVTVRYEIIERAATDSYFYVFARSNRLGLGADQWQTWGGEPGQTGTAKLRVTPSADDYSVTAGIANTGAIRILDMKIVRGTGWPNSHCRARAQRVRRRCRRAHSLSRWNHHRTRRVRLCIYLTSVPYPTEPCLRQPARTATSPRCRLPSSNAG